MVGELTVDEVVPDDAAGWDDLDLNQGNDCCSCNIGEGAFFGWLSTETVKLSTPVVSTETVEPTTSLIPSKLSTEAAEAWQL